MTLPVRRTMWLPLITLVLGCTLLSTAFAVSATPEFFVPTSLAVALVWTAGGLWARRLIRPRKANAWGWQGSLGLSVAAAVATAILFLVGTWILALLPFTRDFLLAASTAASATQLWLTVLVATLTGWGEEIFFRGALPAYLGRHGQAWAILVYTASTVFTGNVVLVLAAPILGTICQLVLNRTGRLWTACVVHTGFSLGVVGLVPLLLR